MSSRLIFLIGVLVLSAPLSATPTWCQGTLDAVYVSKDGSFLLSGTWRNDYTKICDLHQTWNGIAPETCAFWFALMATSKTNSKTVTVYYDTTYSCATLPTYGSSPAPEYVMQN